MRQTIKKYLTPASYVHRWRKIRRSWKVSSLERKKIVTAAFIPLWKVQAGAFSEAETGAFQDPGKEEVLVGAFGIEAGKEINWMEDVPGKQVFPSLRFDKIKMSAYYNRGIDVKYPWELSRFIFGSELAARYKRSGKKAHYTRFRELVLDWIRSNPFLVGVNWACTMDVAIRATNWILAANAFAPEIEKDKEFAQKFSGSLVEHGMYIDSFPEIYPGNHSTNHTTADYLGLLYVARALPEHPDSSRWQQKAVDGLVSCMNYQVYADGGSFEASAAYHRLVTELFGLGALLCLKQDIGLPEAYYERLNSMFGFLFSICDEQGNAPLFGDNDSGTLLQFDFTKNHDYSYMKAFYSHLFSRETGKKKTGEEHLFRALLPAEPVVFPGRSGAKGLKPKEMRLFKESGILAFRHGELSGSVQFISIGQNGRGGHNHLDAGSFVLFFAGEAVVVDPGVFTYTREFELRNRYRAYSTHNTVIPMGMSDESFNTEQLFGLDPYFKVLDCRMEQEQKFTLSYRLLNHPHPISREFHVEENSLRVTDTTQGAFGVKIHFGPAVNILETAPGTVRSKLFTLRFDPDREYKIESCEIARKYQAREKAQQLILQAESTGTMNFDFRHAK